MRSSAGIRPSRISQTMHSGPGIIGNIPPSRRPNAVRSMIGPNSAWTGNTIRPCDYPSKFGKSSLIIVYIYTEWSNRHFDEKLVNVLVSYTKEFPDIR